MAKQFWQDRSTLVTGATGLVGGWLIPTLTERGARVTAVVRDSNSRAGIFALDGWSRRISVAGISLGDCGGLREIIELHEIDTIFHLAGQTQVGRAREYPAEALEHNARSTWNVLEAARSTRNCQVLVASSEKVYGKSGALPYREEDPLKGDSPYDVSKICADLISKMYASVYGLPVAIVRCANLFGGGDCNLARTVPGAILATLKGERFAIRGDGGSVRDFLHVQDAVDAFLLVAERLSAYPELRGEPFNFSLERPIAVIDIVRMILRLAGRTDLDPAVENCAVDDIREQYSSSEKARRVLGWAPKISLEEGLRMTIGWYAENYAFSPVSQSATSGALC
jgi:CDP-glucose 4,6-dehydratase